MIDFSNTSLDYITLHRIGNKYSSEDNVFAKELYSLSDEQREKLLSFCLIPFKAINEIYKFHHISDLSYNEMNGFCGKIFKRSDTFFHRSLDIVKHLYNQSDHPNIKIGEVFVVFFSNIIFENELMDAVGVFKSENKETFFKFNRQGDKITFSPQQGINIKKMDKGCLILNCDAENGFKILNIDNNNSDSEYWLNQFLNVEFAKEENYYTKNYISLCQNFSNEIIVPEIGRKEGISFINSSLKYFSENERFDQSEFVDNIFDSQKLKQHFNDYKNKFEEDHDLQLSDNFDVSLQVLNKQKKKIKNQIILDNKIQIKLPITENVGERFIEKGFDKEKKMHYYKIYFNNENN